MPQTYRLELHSTLFNTLMVNRFYYQQSDDAGSAADLVAAFEEIMLPVIAGLQATDVTYDRIYAYELDDPADVFEQLALVTTQGARPPLVSGDHCFGPFVTWSFRLVVARRDVRNGRKAFSGVRESDVGNDFVPDDSNGILAAIALFETTMLGNIRYAQGQDQPYQPVLYSPPNLTHPTTTIIPRLSSVGFIGVSTQNTRKQ